VARAIVLVMAEEERDVLTQVQALARIGVGDGVLEQGVPGGCIPSMSRRKNACTNVTELCVIRSVMMCDPMA
jgi:hypothetical protein